MGFDKHYLLLFTLSNIIDRFQNKVSPQSHRGHRERILFGGEIPPNKRLMSLKNIDV
jgi:hypothetical protein